MKAANRVILNTSILGIKIVITVVISLFTTRIVLNALGVVDYGIFNLVAGIILMLSFLKNAMATSTQRYLSYYQGMNELDTQKKVFWNSWILHFVLGLGIVGILEIVGLFLFDGFLNIPPERINAAKFIYHFLAFNIFFLILSIPFNGSLVAHENMLFISIVNVLEVVLKLGIALFLYVTTWDRLKMYGMLMGGISFLSFLVYMTYCKYKYSECKTLLTGDLDIPLIRELGAFAGWNLLGSACSLGRTQGLAVILNLFFGAFINSAYGIANQVSSQLNNLSSTLLKSINPQIMKNEGAGERNKMLRLSMIASKFGFFILALVAVPIIFEMEPILKVWLKEVPEYTVIFCQLVLIGAIINQLTIGLQSAIQATGNIKLYQSVVGGVLLLNIPMAFILLKIGFDAHYVLISYVIIETIACVLRLYIAKTIADLSIMEYFERVFYKELITLFIIVYTSYALSNYFNFKFSFILTVIITNIIGVIIIYFSGLCHDERNIFKSIVDKLKFKLNAKQL